MKEFAAFLKAVEGMLRGSYGDCNRAKSLAHESIRESPKGDNRILASIALAQCGESTTADQIDAEANKEYPEETLLHKVDIPLVRATNSLRKGDGAGAVTALEVSRPYEMGLGPGSIPYRVLYVRGEGYLQQKDADRAIGEFQKILNNPGICPVCELAPMARLQMARGYVMKGDKANAKTAYQNLLAMWKDADPDVPVLVQAKAEYAKLQ